MSAVRSNEFPIQLFGMNHTLYGVLTIESYSPPDVNGTGRVSNEEEDPHGAASYVTAVILVYGLSIIFLIGSHVFIRRRREKSEADTEGLVDKFIEEASTLREMNARESFKRLKFSLVPMLAESNARELMMKSKNHQRYQTLIIRSQTKYLGRRLSQHNDDGRQSPADSLPRVHKVRFLTNSPSLDSTDSIEVMDETSLKSSGGHVELIRGDIIDGTTPNCELPVIVITPSLAWDDAVSIDPLAVSNSSQSSEQSDSQEAITVDSVLGSLDINRSLSSGLLSDSSSSSKNDATSRDTHLSTSSLDESSVFVPQAVSPYKLAWISETSLPRGGDKLGVNRAGNRPGGYAHSIAVNAAYNVTRLSPGRAVIAKIYPHKSCH